MEARGYRPDASGLEQALREGSEVAIRAEAAFLLGYLQAGSAKDALIKALSDESARVRVEAALALARLGDTEVALPVLKQELKGQLFQEAPLRAARALALLGDPSGYPRVMEALASEFPSNRMEAIAVLPAFTKSQTTAGGPIDPIGRLIAATHDSEPLLRRDALSALAAIPDGRARAAIAAATSDPDEQVSQLARQFMTEQA